MAISVNNYAEFDKTVSEYWNKTPLFGFVLHDSRISHNPVAAFLEQSAEWLDDLAVQSGVYILFPLRTKEGEFDNPSPAIAKRFGLQSNRLPGIVLFTTENEEGLLASRHFLFVPLEATDFTDIATMQAMLADIFSIVQTVLDAGSLGHDALDAIRKELSRRRRRKTKDTIIASLRSGAQIVLKQFPEKFLTAFAEGFGGALGATLTLPK